MRTSIAGPIVAAILVAIVGGLAGWYVYLRTHENAIRVSDAARGFSTTGGLIGGASENTKNILSGNTGVSFPGDIAPDSAFLNTSKTGTSSEEHNPPTTANTIQFKTPRLWHVAKTPIAGFGFTTADGALTLRYAERATGYIFAADPIEGNVTRLTNTLRPKTQQAYFSNEFVIERSIEDGVVTSFSGTVGRGATTTTLIGSKLNDNISFISIDPSTASIFYLTPTATGSIGTVSKADGSSSNRVFTSILSGWKPIIMPGHLAIEQLSSDNIPGYAYEIGKNGALSEIVGNVPGLQILPRASSTALLWSSADSSGVNLFARTAASSTDQKISLRTIADKCVWAPMTGTTSLFAYCAVPRTLPPVGFLDKWHQGAYHSNDAWWQVDVGANATQALYATEESPDVHSPQIDPTGRFIAFIDGRDGSLWVLRVVK